MVLSYLFMREIEWIFNTSTKKLSTPVKGAKIVPNMTVDELVREYGGCAFGAGRLAEAVDIYYEMLASEKTTKFFGLAGAMTPAGMRNIVADLDSRRPYRCPCHNRSQYGARHC